MLLIRHPKIYLNARGDMTDAMLFDEGYVRAVGDEARALHDGQHVVEPEGACLFPALADAHIHLWGLGIRAGTVELRGLMPREIYDVLREATLVADGWVLGANWDQNAWAPGERLVLDELDRMFPHTPVCLRRVDGHALQVNSEALRRAQIGPDYIPGAGGHAERDGRGGLTGKLVDAAMFPVLQAIPEPGEEEDLATFMASAKMLLRYGITSAHMAWTPIDRLKMMIDLRTAESLPIRVYLMMDGEDRFLDQLLHLGPHHDEEAWLSWRAIKFFSDGAMGSQGAHLLDPYQDGTRGLPMMEADVLARKTRQLMELGWQIAVHAIGDCAARTVLDAFEAVPEPVRAQLRPRLEHAQIVQEVDCERFGPLSTVASIQPIHMYSDAPWAHRVLGTGQLERLFPWRDLAKSTPLAGGSDYPIDDPNPWHGIATAMTRRHARGEVFGPEHVLSLEESLAAYTTGAAYAAHWEDRVGQLQPGFVADAIVLDRDPFASTAEEIWDTEVLRVWVGGREWIDEDEAPT